MNMGSDVRKMFVYMRVVLSGLTVLHNSIKTYKPCRLMFRANLRQFHDLADSYLRIIIWQRGSWSWSLLHNFIHFSQISRGLTVTDPLAILVLHSNEITTNWAKLGSINSTQRGKMLNWLMKLSIIEKLVCLQQRIHLRASFYVCYVAINFDARKF